MENPNAAIALLFLTTLLSGALTAESYYNFIGVNYGTQGNNLPPPSVVVSNLKRCNVGKVRLFEPVPEILEALRGGGFEVCLGIRNEDLMPMALNPDLVATWIAQHVEPYTADMIFRYITAGNEVIPGELGQYVLPVMQTVRNILVQKGWTGIYVSTVIPASVLASSYPPSNGAFTAETVDVMRGIVSFLSSIRSPLCINVYPYFAYASDPVNVALNYADFTATEPVVQDGPLGYRNLFEAVVDSFVWAMEKVGVPDVDLVISESGWPNGGNGDMTTPRMASVYVKGFLRHIEWVRGTPKRPGVPMEGFVFAMMNENLKPPGVEQYFGVFYPNMTAVF